MHNFPYVDDVSVYDDAVYLPIATQDAVDFLDQKYDEEFGYTYEAY